MHASNNKVQGRQLWTSWSPFKVQIEAKPWLITGDFNVVKIIEEKSGNET